MVTGARERQHERWDGGRARSRVLCLPTPGKTLMAVLPYTGASVTSARPRRHPALFPMPVEGLFSHPDYVNLPVAGRGMLLSLCEHYWRGGCRWFPADDDQLFAIARAHRPTWRRWRGRIVSIFDAIRPEFDAYHRKRTGNRAGLIAAGQTGNATRRLKAMHESIALARAARLDLPSAGMAPRRQPKSAPRPTAAPTQSARPKFRPSV